MIGYFKFIRDHYLFVAPWVALELMCSLGAGLGLFFLLCSAPEIMKPQDALVPSQRIQNMRLDSQEKRIDKLEMRINDADRSISAHDKLLTYIAAQMDFGIKIGMAVAITVIVGILTYVVKTMMVIAKKGTM